MNCKNCHDQIEIVAKNKRVKIDACIAPIIEALNNHHDIQTAPTSCCGHGKHKASFLAMIKDKYVFFEVDLHTPLETWDRYRAIHESMLSEKAIQQDKDMI